MPSTVAYVMQKTVLEYLLKPRRSRVLHGAPKEKYVFWENGQNGPFLRFFGLFWAILSPIIFKFGLYIGLNRYDRRNKFERFILKNESKMAKKCPKSGGATFGQS